MAFNKVERRNKIRRRIRGAVSGSAERPRLAVFRSNKEIYAQLIDDNAAKTLASASSRDKSVEGTKTEQAKLVGKLIAEKAQAANITGCVFDRSGYLYHGRVKSLADGAREAGLQF